MPGEENKTLLDDIRILDGTAIKLSAALSMAMDHIGDIFFPGVTIFRIIGRIAMPVFAFFVAEGYIHTHDKKKYLLRLFIFALVSEIPFDLALIGRIGLDHQNIMFTFTLAVSGLMVFDRITRPDEFTGKTDLSNIFVGAVFIILLGALALFLRFDYSFFAVVAVFIFYFLKDRKHWIRVTAGAGFLTVTRTMGYYIFTFLSLIPLLMYNGQRGKGFKWFFYVFYPGHLMILFLIRTILKV